MTFKINRKKYNKAIGKYKDMKIHNAIYLVNKFFIAMITLFSVYAIASPAAFTIKQMQGNIITSKKNYDKILLIDLVMFIAMVSILAILIIIDKKKSPNLYHKTIEFNDNYYYIDKSEICNAEMKEIEITDDYFKFCDKEKKICMIVFEFYDNEKDLMNYVRDNYVGSL